MAVARTSSANTLPHSEKALLLVIPEGVGPVNPVNPCSCSVIFSLGVLRLFLGAPG
jgi:hypothetical protein